MKNLQVRILLNRVQYDPSKDLAEIFAYFFRRGINLTFKPIHSDIKGYTVKEVQNPFGNLQYVLSGAESLVAPLLDHDDICCLVIQGFKEFGVNIPSESADKNYTPNTKTIFIAANADDQFYDQYPNFKVWLQHELLHAVGALAINEGFPIIDPLDVLLLPNGHRLYYHLTYDMDNVNSAATNLWEQLYSKGYLIA